MRKLALIIALSTICIAPALASEIFAAAAAEHKSSFTQSQTVSTFSMFAIDPRYRDFVAAVGSRGRQSASMLVVRKGGGRNINNDRYICINVDDNPDPFAELRRLLDLNLAYNYGDQTFKALAVEDLPRARAAAEKAAKYSPNN